MNIRNNKQPKKRRRWKKKLSSWFMTGVLIFMLVARLGARFLKPYIQNRREQVAQQEVTQQTPLQKEAEAALVSFFDLLASQQYAEASSYYGGSYKALAAIHPKDAGDPAALLADACLQDGYFCFPIQEIKEVHQVGIDEYEFNVHFSSSTVQLSGQDYPVLVENQNGRFQVKTLPLPPS